MRNSQESGLTEFVLDKVPSFDVLNAPDLLGGETKFVEELVKNLPELSEMAQVSPEKKGHVGVYRYGDEHTFYVKEVPDITLAYEEKDEQTAFSIWEQEYKRVHEYFEDYMPQTVLVKRFSREKDKNEFLVVQDICTGDQFKTFIKRYGELKDPEKVELPPTLKQELEKVYTETGFEIDFDFFIDLEKEQIRVFDFDFQDYGSNNHLRMMADLVSRKYGVVVPDGLKITSTQRATVEKP